MLTEFSRANTQHQMRKELKMNEDPWDNYLVHDSKYFMPLLCHSTSLRIEEQIVVSKFIQFSIKLENISEYKPAGNQLVKYLLDFAQDFKDDEEDPSLIERIQAILSNP